MKKKWTAKQIKGAIKDAVIYAIITGLLVFVGFLFFDGVTREDILDHITQYVGALVTILLGVIGIIEFAYDNGLTLLVPTSFETYKENKLREQTKHSLREFFHHEAEYFSQHSNSRITFFLNQLGLNRNQFEQLKIDILEIKLLPLHNLEDAKEKVKRIVQKGNVILKQDGTNSEELVYKEVKYFLNFTDIMFVEDYFTQITDCLAYLITEKTKEKNIEFDRILVTNRGNFLLGMGVSQKLDVALIKVTEKPLIQKSRSWIGNFSSDRPNQSIIVHDVLVSGKQLEESMEIVSKSTEIVGIFCIVTRLDHDGKKELERKYGIPIYSLMDLSDEDVEALIDENV